jgi:hypothetical protein
MVPEPRALRSWLPLSSNLVLVFDTQTLRKQFYNNSRWFGLFRWPCHDQSRTSVEMFSKNQDIIDIKRRNQEKPRQYSSKGPKTRMETDNPY